MERATLGKQTVVDRLAEENAFKKLRAKNEKLAKKVETRETRKTTLMERNGKNTYMLMNYLKRKLPYAKVNKEIVDNMSEGEFSNNLKRAKKFYGGKFLLSIVTTILFFAGFIINVFSKSKSSEVNGLIFFISTIISFSFFIDSGHYYYESEGAWSNND